MKKAVFVFIAFALALGTTSTLIAKEEAKTVTLKGEYQWTQQDEPGDIEAIFKPTADDAWDVSFYFNFRDEDHIYSGTAKGSLTGELAGEVLSDGENPTPFKFEGMFMDGTFNGTHSTTRDDKVRQTGTITLHR